MSAIRQHLERTPRALLILVSLAALALIGTGDYLTGFNLSFAVFYLLDIGFAAWLVGRGFALALSALSILISVAGDWAAGAHYSSVLIPIWNALILTVVYIVVVWLLGALRAAQRALERKVDHRTTALIREMGERERLETEIFEISERIAVTRNLADGVAPLDVQSGGLITALRGLAANVSQMSTVACTLKSDSPPVIEDATAATHLYRIAQEAVHNALRHGRPRRIVMSLSRVRDRAELTIRDDGTGLADNWQGGRGLGTRIMAHRAAMIGGVLSIEPDPAGGTFVTCSFPLAHAT